MGVAMGENVEVEAKFVQYLISTSPCVLTCLGLTWQP